MILGCYFVMVTSSNYIQSYSDKYSSLSIILTKWLTLFKSIFHGDWILLNNVFICCIISSWLIIGIFFKCFSLPTSWNFIQLWNFMLRHLYHVKYVRRLLETVLSQYVPSVQFTMQCVIYKLIPTIVSTYPFYYSLPSHRANLAFDISIILYGMSPLAILNSFQAYQSYSIK